MYPKSEPSKCTLKCNPKNGWFLVVAVPTVPRDNYHLYSVGQNHCIVHCTECRQKLSPCRDCTVHNCMADTLPPVWMGARMRPEQTGAVLSFCNFILYLFYILFVFQAQVSGHWRPLRKSRFTPRKGAGYPGFLGFADRRLSLRQVDWVLIPVDQSSGGVGWRGAAWWAAAPRTATSSCCAAALELKIWRPPVLNWSHELFLVELHRYSIVCEEEWCRISSLIHTEPFLVWNPFSALLSFFSLVLYFRDPCSCIGQLLSSADTNHFFWKNVDHTDCSVFSSVKLRSVHFSLASCELLAPWQNKCLCFCLCLLLNWWAFV